MDIFEELPGMDVKRIGMFLGLVLGTALLFTFIYWAAFGFDHWQTEMGTASDLMMVAAVPPAGQVAAVPGGAGQYVCPVHGAVGLPNVGPDGSLCCPFCGQAMVFRSSASGNLTQAAMAGG